MPQFELANFLPQLVWLAVFFAILYFGVVRLTLPRLGKVMTAREDQVTGDLDVAGRAKDEADRMQADYDASVAEAQVNARARLGEAQRTVAQRLEAKLAESKAALDAGFAEAQASLEAARAGAMTEIESVAADAAGDIVEKLTGTRPAPTETAGAARAALA